MKPRAMLDVFVATLVACGASCANHVLVGAAAGSGSSAASSSASSGGPADAGSLASPPPPGQPHAPDGTTPSTFAITKLYLGDTDPDDTPDPTNGWRGWGYDLDGQDDTGSTTNHCRPVDGMHQEYLANGNDGIDNSFGRNILPILLGISSTTSVDVDSALAAGAPAVLITINQLGPQASYDPLSASVAAGAQLGTPPKLDGTDSWPFIQGTTASLPASYLTGDTWVSGPPTTNGSVTVTLTAPPFLKSPGLKLTIGHAIISMKLDAAHQHAAGGIIAGVIATKDFEAALLAAVSADPSSCYSSFGSILLQTKEAADILTDGTQDPNQTCDGISIGLGFDASPVLLGPAVPPPPPPPNPCVSDGGP